METIERTALKIAINNDVTIGKLKAALSVLPDDDRLIPNQVGNLSIMRECHKADCHQPGDEWRQVGYVDLGVPEVVTY